MDFLAVTGGILLVVSLLILSLRILSRPRRSRALKQKVNTDALFSLMSIENIASAIYRKIIDPWTRRPEGTGDNYEAIVVVGYYRGEDPKEWDKARLKKIEDSVTFLRVRLISQIHM